MADEAREWTERDARDWIAVPDGGGDKYSRGVLGVITGSDAYPGAAVLGVEAAHRTGVGMVRYLGGERASTLVLSRRPEAVTGDGRVQAWLAGSGMSASDRDDATATRLERAFGQEGVPLVVDAGALDLVPRAAGPVVVTPHARELTALFGYAGHEVSVDRVRAEPERLALEAARELGCTVLLKGSTTHVASPAGELFAVSLATPWLATAGAGDVLGGVLGAMVATNADRLGDDPHAVLARVAVSAAAVHGLAARAASGGGPIAALDVARAVPGVVADLLAG